jgi:PleD family two-component response regulator
MDTTPGRIVATVMMLGVADGEPTRVLVVDDHRMVREGLRSYLGLVDDIVMIGDASDGRAALDWLPRAKA